MRIETPVYKYIEYELYHYDQYKHDIKAERNDIIISANCVDGQPKGNMTTNPVEDKTIKLATSTSILAMERVVKAVDTVLNRLTPEHRKVFESIYILGRKDRYSLCDEIGISEATYTRYKRCLIEMTGKELGVIKS